MISEEFMEKTDSYFAGALEDADNDDLPDGAWFQVLVDTAQFLLDNCKEYVDVKPPANIDAHDVVMYWMEHRESVDALLERLDKHATGESDE